MNLNQKSLLDGTWPRSLTSRSMEMLSFSTKWALLKNQLAQCFMGGKWFIPISSTSPAVGASTPKSYEAYMVMNALLQTSSFQKEGSCIQFVRKKVAWVSMPLIIVAITTLHT